MQVPLQITIRDIPHSSAVEQRIRRKAEKLDIFSERVISCNVVVELTQRHKNQGKLHNVRINVAIPGKELVVNRNEQENLYVAIRDAFDDIYEKIKAAQERLNGFEKTHPEVLHGKIIRLFSKDGFGFIGNEEGEEFYFNANNVVHPTFKHLSVGLEVNFIEAMGDEGPQAHRVSAKERHIE